MKRSGVRREDARVMDSQAECCRDVQQVNRRECATDAGPLYLCSCTDQA